MVPAQGFEPWTIGLKDRCSAKLSYAGVRTILNWYWLEQNDRNSGSLGDAIA